MPATFLPLWMKLTGTTDADMKKGFASSMAYIGITSLLTAFILSHLITFSMHYTGASGISAGLQTAFWAWLGIGATSIVTAGIMEPRSKMLLAITAGNRLVTMLVMGAILGAFMK
jgi:hypothetical protein